MQINKPYLFIELNDYNFIFLAVQYNESFDFEVLDSLTIVSDGIKNGKVIDANSASNIIKKNLDYVEKKIGFIFKEVTVISSHVNLNCKNVSGFKRLSGAQIQEEDISYVINNIKKIIAKNENDKVLVHLLNTNFNLDNSDLKNLPIGLHGEFYSQHLTFFLLPKIEIKNLELVFKKCDLDINRIVHQSFANGINLINKYKNEELFASIKIDKNTSNISIFKNHSFVYFQHFNFGTDIILKDLSKICSLELKTTRKIIENLNFDNIIKNKDQGFLDRKYFEGVYRKISLEHLTDIINARIEEIIHLIFRKNVNINYFKDKIKIINISFKDSAFENNFKYVFERQFKDTSIVKIDGKDENEDLKASMAAAELIGKGWSKEAIPIIQTKKSIISRIFSRLFA